MSVSENAAYLKGLFDGYELSDTKENKIIAKLLDLVADMADEIAALKADNAELHEYVEELDHDLGEVEEYLMDECDCDCDCCDEDEDEDDDFDDENGDFYEVTCPGCGEVICFDESIDPENLTCPACNEKFSCDIEED